MDKTIKTSIDLFSADERNNTALGRKLAGQLKVQSIKHIEDIPLVLKMISEVRNHPRSILPDIFFLPLF
jgi:hypothetical protein